MSIDRSVSDYHDRRREAERQGYEQGRNRGYGSNPHRSHAGDNNEIAKAWFNGCNRGRTDSLYPSGGSYRR